MSGEKKKNENQKLPQYRAYFNKFWYVHGTEDYVAIKTNEGNVFFADVKRSLRCINLLTVKEQGTEQYVWYNLFELPTYPCKALF